jgi:hypothetical protein
MRNSNSGRTPASDLSAKEWKVVDEFISSLTRVAALENKFSVSDLAYILGLVFSEEDLKNLKEEL